MDMNVYVQHHKNATLHAFYILFTVNYCLFANCDVSIRFNGKDDNVVLEFNFLYIWKVKFCYSMSKMACESVNTIL